MMETITAIATAFATVLSAISVFILVRDNIIRKKSEKMNLIITPKKRIGNDIDEIFYLFLSFSNESSLPISILDLKLYESRHYESSITASGYESGTLTIHPRSVIETNRGDQTVRTDYHTLSTTTPSVLEPYSAFAGYHAFHEPGQDSFILCSKEVDLIITTSRKSYKVKMDLNSVNFYDYSYRDDGLVFGHAVTENFKQDTSVPKSAPI